MNRHATRHQVLWFRLSTSHSQGQGHHRRSPGVLSQQILLCACGIIQ
jgi:hypothetical protein